MVAQAVPKRWTAEQVMHLVELGAFQDEHVELIEGELIVVPPQGPVHAALAADIHALLIRQYGDGFHVRGQTTISATADSLPEPDVSVIRGLAKGPFLRRLPGAADTVLVVEIAYSTRAHDRRKAGVYAKAGFQTYWLVDVDARKVEVRAAPKDGEYTFMQIVGDDAVLTLPEINKPIDASALLP